ncbi:Bckti12 [Botrytis cinerea B05.10]|uniref:Bckti12 n=2 Tax=Botryotinia fuckeliana TaxID=40559 RepID=A0A384JH89_BOTFB|nr:Bckti12 [Botrytis cinerea B05.10]ATZ49948.1 Bckti12 [Botrytis cinerea B05.10]CCD46557.1 similar to RNA polymerase II Elongator complex associated protein Kti12 [Botrytis cinerea T4]
MPLIILTGYPTSGKTYRATQLREYFHAKISSLPPSSPSASLRVHLISDHTLAISREVYNLESKSANERSNNASEKDARATIYGAVKRVLSNKDVVILDGGNYIKGWRYQLFCEAKAMRTGCCVLHVGVPADKAKEVNEVRLERRDLTSSEQSVGEVQIKEEDKAYEKDNWDNLVFRYEEPNAMVRWDSPLFTVVWEDENVPGDAIWDAIIGDDSEGKRKIVRPNAATVAKVHSSEGFLYELDKTTQTVLNRVLEWSKDHPGEGGGEISVGENSKGDELVVELPGDPVGLPTLQRLRRQFISLQRTNPVTVERIKETFVRYLNDSFEA